MYGCAAQMYSARTALVGCKTLVDMWSHQDSEQLHALRDRIGAESAVHLAAQLPMLLRGLYYEGWRMAASQTKERSRAEFFDHVRGRARPA